MKRNYLAILGHQPKLSIAELERQYGSENIEPAEQVCFLDTKPDILKLGGSPKTAEIIGNLPKQALAGIEEAVFNSLKSRLEDVKKMNFGISSLLSNQSKGQLKQIAITLKKRFTASGIKTRYIPNKQMALNSGQVWHNKLDREPNSEIILVQHNNQIYIARTIGVQNIDSYSKRDRDKPVRDPKIGMLPPKLARLMINLAMPSGKVLDPFCGTGTVLMEASLMDFPTLGSDISVRMVEATLKNMAWLKKKYNTNVQFKAYDADAQEEKWSDDVSAVVSESYLGPPLKKFPDDIGKIVGNIDMSLRSVLRNFARQDFSKNYLCLAVPAWYDKSKDRYILLPLVDDLPRLKYNLVDLKHVDAKRLIYRRPEQIVARQILIIKRS